VLLGSFVKSDRGLRLLISRWGRLAPRHHFHNTQIIAIISAVFSQRSAARNNKEWTSAKSSFSLLFVANTFPDKLDEEGKQVLFLYSRDNMNQ